MGKGIWTLIGFTLFIMGFVALVLSLVGVKLAFLTWIDASGRLIGLLIRLSMILIGAIVIVMASGNWREKETML